MGILDTVMGALGGKGDSSMATLKGIAELVDQHGGIAGIAQKFQSGGLDEIMKSWISTGKNLPISANQIQAVLGSDTISNLSQKTGLNPETLKQKLTEILPNVVDKLTPNGQLPGKGIDFSQILAVGTELLGKSKS